MVEFIEDLLGGIVNFGILPQDSSPGARTDLLVRLITNGLTLLFVAIIILAIVYAALAGLKYIQSQGDQDKVEEAQKALKAVLFGVGAVFIGIIGVVVIASVFSTQNAAQVRRAVCSFIEFNQVDECVAAVGQ